MGIRVCHSKSILSSYQHSGLFLEVAWADKRVFCAVAWRCIWWSALDESLLCFNSTPLHNIKRKARNDGSPGIP